MIVTMQDVRALNYCRSGVKAVLERIGVDWKKFIAGQVTDVDLLVEGSEDGMILAAIEKARERNDR